MTLGDLVEDMHALEDEMRDYERKYGIRSETFYESYGAGEEPPEDGWVRDWTAWASAYELWLRRHQQYLVAVRSLRAGTLSTTAIIEKTARHEPVPLPSGV